MMRRPDNVKLNLFIILVSARVRRRSWPWKFLHTCNTNSVCCRLTPKMLKSKARRKDQYPCQAETEKNGPYVACPKADFGGGRRNPRQ